MWQSSEDVDQRFGNLASLKYILHMDELINYNKSRWEALAQARVQYTRPFLDITPQNALQSLDRDPLFLESPFANVAGKDVLCLASGGGQQSTIFSLLGANVTVFDLSETQLARDQEAADHFGYALTIEQGDMQDLSRFADNSFDIVWHPYSINFVPDAVAVIRGVSRIIRPDGFYHLQFSNPFWSMEPEEWTPQGYPIKQPYQTGQKLEFADSLWTFTDDKGNEQAVEGPHEFMHTYSMMVNTLIQSGFVILAMEEWPEGDAQADPGSWDHFVTILPPFVTVAAVFEGIEKRPYLPTTNDGGDPCST